MQADIRTAKQSTRAAVRAALQQLNPDDRNRLSRQLISQLEQWPLFRDARQVAFYAPLMDEPDLWPLASKSLSEGKTVCVPFYQPATATYAVCPVQDLVADVRIGRYGIREPFGECCARTVKNLDLILVPGIAFGLDGHRLGRGKGFYDRLLSGLCGVRCGIAFEQQILPEIPHEPHDMVLDWIVTPARRIKL